MHFKFNTNIQEPMANELFAVGSFFIYTNFEWDVYGNFSAYRSISKQKLANM